MRVLLAYTMFQSVQSLSVLAFVMCICISNVCKSYAIPAYIVDAMKVTTSIVLDNRREKKDGTYPVKLRVTSNRQQKYYPTKHSLTEENFEKTRGVKPRGSFKELAFDFNAIETKAKTAADSLHTFTWEGFEKKYSANKSVRDLVSNALGDYAKEMRAAGRIGNAVTYECAKSSLEKFNRSLTFTDVTPQVLHQYERWMLSQGNSITTVGIYLRSLRTLFNNAIADGRLTKEQYPFGKRRYEIAASKNRKKALSISDIGLIYNYECDPDSSEAVCRDYWLFMYFCSGINVKDMCLLKYSSMQGEVIVFERAKTARTKRNVEAIRVPLTEDLRKIIRRRGNKNRDDAYIFPVLKKRLSPERERQLIQQLTHVINSHMRSLANKLAIANDVTTYVARHSFATILKHSGQPIEVISEQLGHGDIRTTRNYLASFEDNAMAEAVKALTAFKVDKKNNTNEIIQSE